MKKKNYIAPKVYCVKGIMEGNRYNNRRLLHW